MVQQTNAGVEVAGRRGKGTEILVGGIPASRFLGRVLLNKGRDTYGARYSPCVLIEVGRNQLKVRPAGHHQEVWVDPAGVRPNWKDNSDLRPGTRERGAGRSGASNPWNNRQ